MFRFLELGRSKVHSKLKKDGNAFRLLYLEPADDYHAEVRCELRQVNLDKRPVYKALSYAWGDPSLTLPIFINGKTHHVTANCHAALLRLRETGERCMWIDAICINQEDDKEKSTQVALMRDIYHFADEVIVWLGRAQAERSPNDEQDEKKVMAMINTFRLEPFNDGASFLRYALPFGRDVGWGSWTKLNELFKHHWFSRLWAHQEYTVALKARALLQYHSEPFDKIAGCASRLQTALALENWEESMGGLPWPSDLSESVLGVVHRISPRNEYDRHGALPVDVPHPPMQMFGPSRPGICCNRPHSLRRKCWRWRWSDQLFSITIPSLYANHLDHNLPIPVTAAPMFWQV
jgi:Heterokaryon incompatibility protein (HET)